MIWTKVDCFVSFKVEEDPETIAQLDWLWSNSSEAAGRSLVELSQQVDRAGCVKEELKKPIEKYVFDVLKGNSET